MKSARLGWMVAAAVFASPAWGLEGTALPSVEAARKAAAAEPDTLFIWSKGSSGGTTLRIRNDANDKAGCATVVSLGMRHADKSTLIEAHEYCRRDGGWQEQRILDSGLTLWARMPEDKARPMIMALPMPGLPAGSRVRLDFNEPIWDNVGAMLMVLASPEKSQAWQNADEIGAMRVVSKVANASGGHCLAMIGYTRNAGVESNQAIRACQRGTAPTISFEAGDLSPAQGYPAKAQLDEIVARLAKVAQAQNTVAAKDMPTQAAKAPVPVTSAPPAVMFMNTDTSSRNEQLHGTAAEAQVIGEMRARLKAALAKGDVAACKREGDNLARYQQAGKGQALIAADAAAVDQRLRELSTVFDQFRQIQELNSKKAVEKAYGLIRAIAVKMAEDAVTEVTVTVVTAPVPGAGKVVVEMGKQATDFLGNFNDAGQLVNRARALRSLELMAQSAREQMATLRPAISDAQATRTMLSECMRQYQAGVDASNGAEGQDFDIRIDTKAIGKDAARMMKDVAGPQDRIKNHEARPPTYRGN